MIRLIAAIDSKRGVAKDGLVPWSLPSDLARLRSLTKTCGGNVLMGRTTYLTINHPLVNRHTYVVSRSSDIFGSGIKTVNDLEQFLTDFKEDIWVFGGAQVFAETIDKADELYLTLVDHDFHCDKFFPDYLDKFKLESSESVINESGFNFHYEDYIRK